MHRLALMIICLFGFVPLLNLSAEAQLLKIGDFALVERCHDGKFRLDDGNIYAPISAHQRKNTDSWQLGETILVLKRGGKNDFTLVNQKRGQEAKVRVSKHHSCE